MKSRYRCLAGGPEWPDGIVLVDPDEQTVERTNILDEPRGSLEATIRGWAKKYDLDQEWANHAVAHAMGYRERRLHS